MFLPSFLLFHKRHAESTKQGAAFFVSASRSNYGNVHAPRPINFVEVTLLEDQLILNSNRVSAATSKGARADAAKIAQARQHCVDEAIQKLVHPLAAQRHRNADGHPPAQ